MDIKVKNYALNSTPQMEEQISEIANSEAFKNNRIRIMPDGHAGKGCVVGTTIKYSDKIVPNIVGVDIACRVSMIELNIKRDNITDDFLRDIDEVIHNYVPSGRKVHDNPVDSGIDYTQLRCYDAISDKVEYFERSLGTMGGNNHYIELDASLNHKAVMLSVHCGSRNLGVQVCNYYQKKAIEAKNKRIAHIKDFYNGIISNRKHSGYTNDIQNLIEERNYNIALEPADDLCYLEGQDMEDYLNDMDFCNSWSYNNHRIIVQNIMMGMREKGYEDLDIRGSYSCIHNYVDTREGYIRKGAIDASAGKLCIIPLNMHDGILLAVGKGNEDWNCSAPHGAGRIMSRAEARKNLNIDDYKEKMIDVYTTCVNSSTIDEAPGAYKDASAIEEAIKDTCTVIDHLYPIYNFKASE